jgi:hypothetical protein
MPAYTTGELTVYSVVVRGMLGVSLIEFPVVHSKAGTMSADQCKKLVDL